MFHVEVEQVEDGKPLCREHIKITHNGEPVQCVQNLKLELDVEKPATMVLTVLIPRANIKLPDECVAIIEN